MVELPILFSAPMVRAILEGRKTVTRRIVKFPHHNPLGQWEPMTVGTEKGALTAAGISLPLQEVIWHTRTGDSLICPHGQPGDRLWVRETFKSIASGEVKNGYGEVRYGYAYKADSATRWNERPTIIHDLTGQPGKGPMQFQPRPWKPSTHMPRRASRITLEVTGVRVERLQDISEDDSLAEGIDADLCRQSIGNAPLKGGYLPTCAFSYLWEKINGAGSWDANPWVWVIAFKRIEQERKAP